MKSSLKITAVALALFVAAFPLSACSQKTSEKKTGFGNASGRNGGSSSQTELVGKVTSVVGNQVVLALGTLNSESEKSGDTAQFSKRSRQADSSSSSGTQPASSGSGSASSSGEMTLTGETATLLIPVGLTISDNNSRRASGSGASSRNGGTQAEGAQAGGAQGGAGGFSGGGSNGGGSNAGGFSGRGGSVSGSRGAASGSAVTMGSFQRSKDFSSITKGMILRVAERKQSDGTQSVVRVTVVSE